MPVEEMQETPVFFTLHLLIQGCDLKTLKVKAAFRWKLSKESFFFFLSGSPSRAIKKNIVLIHVLAGCHLLKIISSKNSLLTNLYLSISHWIFISLLCSCSNGGSCAWISIKVNGNLVLLSHCWKIVNRCFNCCLHSTRLGTWECSCVGII